MELSKFMKHNEREVVKLLPQILKRLKFLYPEVKSGMFLNQSFRPPGSDFSTKERRISITKISITITQYYYIGVFTITE